MAGAIVVLNGTSSSGKSSIARALRNLPGRTWFWLESDNFWAMLPPVENLDEVAVRMAASEALLQSAAIVARRGFDVVIDAVIIHPAFHGRCVEVMAELPAYYVAVRCDVEELERREQARGNRTLGLARWQFERVHADREFDLGVDTTTSSSEECARLICELVGGGETPTAFRRMLNAR